MTNYIINKTTTEVYAVVADSLPAAQKMVEQGDAELAGLNVTYSGRPQQVAPKQ